MADTSTAIFGSNRILLYNVYPWNELGFGVPNFGRNVGSQSAPIGKLVDEIGKAQLFIMTGVDAKRGNPPTANTIVRVCKLVNRVQTILVGRQKDYPEQVLEPSHATQNSIIWRIHPVPYFPGPMIVNGWLAEYNELVMMALMNAMQHSDNSMSLTITKPFAQQIWSFFAEIKLRIGTELLGMSNADASNDTKFLPTDLPLPGYQPDKVILNMEPLQDPGAVFSAPTTDDLKPFFVGIPANLIIPNLAQYPVGPLPGQEGLTGGALAGAFGLPGVKAVTVGTGGSTGFPLNTPAAQAVVDAINANIAALPPQGQKENVAAAVAASVAQNPEAAVNAQVIGAPKV